MKKVLFVICLFVASIASAQNGINYRTDTPILKVVNDLAELYGGFMVAVDAPVDGKTFRGDLSGIRLEPALEKVLAPAGLKAQVRGFTIHLVSATPTAIIATPAYSAYSMGDGDAILARNRVQLYAAFGPGQSNYYSGYSPSYSSWSYGSYGYGYWYVHPYIVERCRNFPQDRSCVMGGIKIDLEQTMSLIRTALRAAGLPLSTEVDMYVAAADEKTGEALTILKNEGPVTKHNNWFNDPYQLKAQTYLVEFVTKKGQNRLFKDYIEVLPWYFTNNKPKLVQLSAHRIEEGEPDRGVIQKREQLLTVDQWRKPQ